MRGDLIHPTIPVAEIASIADVACGTGIWLEDLSNALSTKATSPVSNTERSYHGFDISPAMFPPEVERGPIQFDVLDILQPVPEEYKARFDLVSLRFLCVAVREVDLGRVIRNVEQMISESVPFSCFVSELVGRCKR
jgi:SAM-dependent methyltransferase